MQKIVDIKYVFCECHIAHGGFTVLLANLSEKVLSNMKDGWVPNGSITINNDHRDITAVQAMVKYEVLAKEESVTEVALGIRRKN